MRRTAPPNETNVPRRIGRKEESNRQKGPRRLPMVSYGENNETLLHRQPEGSWVFSPRGRGYFLLL